MRYRYLDILRGLAAFAVLIWHYQHFYYPSAEIGPPADFVSMQPFYPILWPLYHYGGFAVPLFWTLSGFVIAETYLTRRVSSRDYIVARVARLYPLHLLTLLLVAALQLLSLVWVGRFQIYPFNDTYHFALNVLMVQHWGVQEGWSFNAPSWSVSVEIISYAAFLVIVPALRAGPSLAFLFLALTVAAFVAGVTSDILNCAMHFLGGVSCWVLVRRGHFTGFVCAVALILLFGLQALEGRHASSLGTLSLFSAVIILTALADELLVLRTDKLDWFGDATYGTYLLHVPLQIMVLAGVQMAGADMIAIANQPLALVAFIVFVFAAALAASPFENRMKQKIRSRWGSMKRLDASQ